MQNHKKTILFVLIIFLCCFSLSAGKRGWDEVEWSWQCPSKDVKWFRYQLNSEDEANWTVVDSSVTRIYLLTNNRVGSTTTIYVQSSFDGRTWSESGSTTYAGHRYILDCSVKTVLFPYSIALYRFYNGYDTASTRTKTNSVYGFAGTAEFDMALLQWLNLYVEAGYNLAIKQDAVIPGARDVQYFKAGAGVDFTFGLGQKSTIYGGLFGGAMAHVNNKKANITPYFGTRFGYDYAISDSFSVGALSRVSFALFAGRSDALMNSMTILVDPLGVTLTYRF